MSRPILNARLHLIALILVWAGWMFTTGLVLGRLGVLDQPLTWERVAPAGVTLLLTALAWALVTARLPELARRGRLWAAPWISMTGFFGLAGLLFAGALYLQDPAGGPDASALMLARAAFGVLGLCLIVLAPTDAAPPARLFLRSRHASDVIARRSLLAAAGQAMLVTLAFAVFLAHSSSQTFAVMYFGYGYFIGVVASCWQRYPQRLASFTPFGWMLAAIGFLGAWAAPGSTWPLMFLAFGLGLGHVPPRNDLLASLPDAQRTIGLTLMAAALAFGAAIGIALILMVPPGAADPAWFAPTLVLVALAVWSYKRDVVEQIAEPLLAITNPIRAYGPGLKVLPTRGPVLVVANHAAYFDPLWVAKLIPVRLRPLMTSKFYDKPLISCLMRRVFHAIRVPDVGYRREAPEIQEAIAALDRGENVLIFPEGWLKRKEGLTIRRFGQGVYQILREKPQTPVVVCWIEGNWGSYTSYWHGPPMTNKKPDFLRVIRIGISEPEVLSLDLLHDGWATRRHLMQACVRARTFLGLPELPSPPFVQADEGEENSESRSD